jgi:2,4-diketo-3-deoxy-L-fuconate hydrolase
VFAIGINCRSHAEESGVTVLDVPATFTKFPACLAGPFDDVEIQGDTIDWEVELVGVIGAGADRVEELDAWGHVAGLTVSQDISDRTLQFAAGSQFSLGKFRGVRARWDRGSSPETSSPIGTTSRSAARSTARGCRTPAPAT